MARILLFSLCLCVLGPSWAAIRNHRANFIQGDSPGGVTYEGILPPAIIKLLNNSIHEDANDEDNEVEQTNSVTNARMAVAKPGEYPHQVSLRTSSPDSPLPKHFCGASVIHPWLLLSAAHCFERIKPPNILAIPGDHSHSGSEKGEQPRNVTDLILHPKWDNQTWENDIAILVLDEPLEFDENVRPILLRDSNSGPLPETANVTGWGNPRIYGTSPDKLMSTPVSVLPPANCTSKFATLSNYTVTDGMICAESDDKDCSWDCGGPLMCVKNETGGVQKRYLCGIASWGISCVTRDKRRYPRVYMDVAKYNRWVRKYMRVWWKHHWVNILAQPISEDKTCGEKKDKCPKSGLCLPERYMCDGDTDCHPLHDDFDEENCESITCRGTKFQCISTPQCISQNYVCDGEDDCLDGSDETNCP